VNDLLKAVAGEFRGLLARSIQLADEKDAVLKEQKRAEINSRSERLLSGLEALNTASD
jgi:peroxiredoxin